VIEIIALPMGLVLGVAADSILRKTVVEMHTRRHRNWRPRAEGWAVLESSRTRKPL